MSSAVFCVRLYVLRILCHLRGHNFASLANRAEKIAGGVRSIKMLSCVVLNFLIRFVLVEMKSSHFFPCGWHGAVGCFVTLGAIIFAKLTIRAEIFAGGVRSIETFLGAVLIF